MAWSAPAYPEILTKANWDRKKGNIAKMKGATGIGEQMTKCEKLYKAVKWDTIAIGDHPPSYNQFTKSDWDAALKSAKTEIAGGLRKFVESLYKLRDVAKDAATDLNKSKLTKSTGKHCDSIATTADQLGVALNSNSLAKPIQTDYEDHLKRMQSISDSLPGILKKVLARTPPHIKKMREVPTAKNFNAVSVKAARDITQNLTNIVLCLDKRGLSVDGVPPSQLKNLKALSKIFVGWGNANAYLKDNADKNTVESEIERFELAYAKLDSLFG